jgi:hypothetical protein
VAVRFPRLATGPWFEHVFDTAKDNPAGCRLVKFGSQVGGKPMPEHGLMDTVQFADAHGFAAAPADTGGQR